MGIYTRTCSIPAPKVFQSCTECLSLLLFLCLLSLVFSLPSPPILLLPPHSLLPPLPSPPLPSPPLPSPSLGPHYQLKGVQALEVHWTGLPAEVGRPLRITQQNTGIRTHPATGTVDPTNSHVLYVPIHGVRTHTHTHTHHMQHATCTTSPPPPLGRHKSGPQGVLGGHCQQSICLHWH